jgi:hypothetical protein
MPLHNLAEATSDYQSSSISESAVTL